MRIVLIVLLIFTVAGQAHGMGWFGGGGGGGGSATVSGKNVGTNNSNQTGQGKPQEQPGNSQGNGLMSGANGIGNCISVPEPTVALLIGVGMAGLIVLRRKFKK